MAAEYEMVETVTPEQQLQGDLMANRDHDVDPVLDTKDLRIVTAAGFIQDACQGRHSNYRTDEKSLKWKRLYDDHWVVNALRLAVLVDLLLIIFERPGVHAVETSYMITFPIELVCLLLFAGRLILGSLFHKDHQTYLLDKKNIFVGILLVGTLVDMAVYIALENTCCEGSTVRGTRALRPLFLINLDLFAELRRAVRAIRKSLFGLFRVLFLVTLTLFMFALLAYRLFSYRNLTDMNGHPYFKEYQDSLLQLFILLTTANDPDVILPAYNDNTFNVLVFIVFICVCLYLFVNIALAAVMGEYSGHLKDEAMKLQKERYDSLRKAFVILTKEQECQGRLSREMLHPVLQAMKGNYSWIGDKMKIGMLLYVISDKEGWIDQQSFCHIWQLLTLQIIERDNELFAKCLKNVYNSTASRWIIRFVKRHKAFPIIVSLVVVANAVFLGVYFDDETQESGEGIFLLLFHLELLLRMYAYGLRHFFRGKSWWWNMYDFLVIWGATIALVLEITLRYKGKGNPGHPVDALFDVLMTLRVVRILKLLRTMPMFRNTVTTIIRVASALKTYGIILLAVFYIFAVVGMETFAGLISYYPIADTATNMSAPSFNATPVGHFRVNPSADYNSSHNAYARLCGGHSDLEGTDFANLGYCKINFNHAGRAFVTLFSLSIINQWHVIAGGFVARTNKCAYIYFILFYVVICVILTNMITSFVLQAYETVKQEPGFHRQFEERLSSVAELEWERLDMDKVSKTQSSSNEYLLIEAEFKADFMGKFVVECKIPDDQLLLDMMFRNNTMSEDNENTALTDEINHVSQ